MSASSLQSMHDVCFYVSGNVMVHPDAAIAPQVLLQADPGSQLIIHENASIGAGSIIHASGGTIEIGRSATIGSKVLIVGRGDIGENACVGSFSTLMLDIHVAAQQIVPPSSLIGDRSRKVAIQPSQPSSASAAPSSTSSPKAESSTAQPSSSSHSFTAYPPGSKPVESGVASSDVANPDASDHDGSNLNEAEADTSDAEASGAIDSDNSSTVPNSNGYVYGRAAVEQMIRVMFPLRQHHLGGSIGRESHDSTGASAPSNESDVNDQK